jgi:hypothetical protein
VPTGQIYNPGTLSYPSLLPPTLELFSSAFKRERDWKREENGKATSRQTAFLYHKHTELLSVRAKKKYIVRITTLVGTPLIHSPVL